MCPKFLLRLWVDKKLVRKINLSSVFVSQKPGKNIEVWTGKKEKEN